MLREEQYQLFLQFDLDKNIVTDDVCLPLSDDWEDVGRAIRKYKLNETGDALIFCDELEQDYNRIAVYAVMNSYRSERDILLTSTDWTHMIDVKSDDGWKEYRTYLRDFPETFEVDLNDKGEQKIPFNLPKNLDEYRKMIGR